METYSLSTEIVKPTEDSAVYDFIIKKETEGKPKRVVKIAGLNKLLRIYYARISTYKARRLYISKDGICHIFSNRARSFSSALFSILEMYDRDMPSFFAISFCVIGLHTEPSISATPYLLQIISHFQIIINCVIL